MGSRPLGPTLLKRRHLQSLGYKPVQVPHWEWTVAGDEAQEVDYIQGELGLGSA